MSDTPRTNAELKRFEAATELARVAGCFPNNSKPS